MKSNQPKNVQDALIATLRGYGISESTATQIARVLQANSTVRRTSLSSDDREHLFRELLASVDFQALGLNESAAASIRQKLLNKYKAGLDGDLEGPFNYGPQSDSTWDETVAMLQSSSQEEWEQKHGAGSTERRKAEPQPTTNPSVQDSAGDSRARSYTTTDSDTTDSVAQEDSDSSISDLVKENIINQDDGPSPDPVSGSMETNKGYGSTGEALANLNSDLEDLSRESVVSKEESEWTKSDDLQERVVTDESTVTPDSDNSDDVEQSDNDQQADDDNQTDDDTEDSSE